MHFRRDQFFLRGNLLSIIQGLVGSWGIPLLPGSMCCFFKGVLKERDPIILWIWDRSSDHG